MNTSECAWCGQVFETEDGVGRKKDYCCEECQIEAKRAQKRDASRRWKFNHSPTNTLSESMKAIAGWEPCRDESFYHDEADRRARRQADPVGFRQEMFR